MSNLMTDAPAEEIAGCQLAILIDNCFSILYESLGLIPFNSDMISCRIHKCTGEHLHITNI